MVAKKWIELTMIAQVQRINELRSAINVNGRTISDEDIHDVLAIQNYVPTDRNVRLLIDGQVDIDSLGNTRTV